MKPPFVWIVVIGVVLMVAFPIILLVSIPPGTTSTTTGAVPSCPYSPSGLSSLSVPSGQTVLVGETGADNSNPYGGPVPQWRFSIWSNSSSDYSLYLLTLDQYNSYAANGSGFNGSVHYAPPSSYVWSSGPATSTNNTFLFGNGTWDLMVYNPGPATATVSIESVGCNAP